MIMKRAIKFIRRVGYEETEVTAMVFKDTYNMVIGNNSIKEGKHNSNHHKFPENLHYTMMVIICNGFN